MSSTTLYRLGGISLVWGGGLTALGYILHPAGDNPADLVNPLQVPVHLMIFFGILLLVLGLISMYARQSSRVGVWGLVGVLLLFFGLLMNEMPHSVAGFVFFPVLGAKVPPQEALTIINTAFANPALGLMQLLAIPMAVLGVIISAIVTLRAHVLSRAISIALFSIIGIEILSLIPGVADVMTMLKFPAEIYLDFAVVGILILIDKGATAQPALTGVGKKLEVSALPGKA